MRTLALVLILAGLSAALTVEEVVQLSEAGVSDEIIVDQMEADGSSFRLSAADIINLQKRNVSPVVIRFMVTARGKQEPPADAAEGAGLPAPEPAAPSVGEQDAGLTLRNVSKRVLSVLVRSRDGEIVLIEGEIEGATVMFNGSHADLRLASGLYGVRWANEEAFRELAVAKDVKTELEFRDDVTLARGVRAVAIIDGKEEADPVVAQAPDGGDVEAAGIRQDVVYVETAEPVWDGHAFIDVYSHSHGTGCGHWYYDNCWNLYPVNHVYTMLGYSRCGDTGGFAWSGVTYARVWDGLAFLFLRGHVHGSGCGHAYHHGCWNLFPNNHVFRDGGRRHFNPCPPRSRVVVSPVRLDNRASRNARSHGSPAERKLSSSPLPRSGSSGTPLPGSRLQPAQTQNPSPRVDVQPRRQEPKRVEQAPRREQPQRVETVQRRAEPRREPAQRVEPAPRRAETRRIEPAARRQEPPRATPQPRREQPARIQQPARREASQRRHAPKQSSPGGGGHGRRR